MAAEHPSLGPRRRSEFPRTAPLPLLSSRSPVQRIGIDYRSPARMVLARALAGYHLAFMLRQRGHHADGQSIGVWHERAEKAGKHKIREEHPAVERKPRK